jgi:hypothetical protein
MTPFDWQGVTFEEYVKAMHRQIAASAGLSYEELVAELVADFAPLCTGINHAPDCECGTL